MGNEAVKLQNPGVWFLAALSKIIWLFAGGKPVGVPVFVSARPIPRTVRKSSRVNTSLHVFIRAAVNGSTTLTFCLQDCLLKYSYSYSIIIIKMYSSWIRLWSVAALVLHYNQLSCPQDATHDASVNIRVMPAAKTHTRKTRLRRAGGADIENSGRDALRPAEVIFSISPKLERGIKKKKKKKWKIDTWNATATSKRAFTFEDDCKGNNDRLCLSVISSCLLHSPHPHPDAGTLITCMGMHAHMYLCTIYLDKKKQSEDICSKYTLFKSLSLYCKNYARNIITKGLWWKNGGRSTCPYILYNI